MAVPKQSSQVKIESNAAVAKALPVRQRLTAAYLSSLLIVILTVIAAVAGLLFPEDLYPTADLQESSVPNDIVTLVIGVPILAASIWFAWRGSLLALLLWPGAIFYGLYNYFIYLFGMPLTPAYPLYLAIVTISLYTLIAVVANIRGEPVSERLGDRVSERFSGAVLIVLGILFSYLAFNGILNGLAVDAPVSRHELGLASADVILSAAWIIAGIMLWRRRTLGYVSGTGLYFQGSMLFIGLILLLVLQPLLTAADLMLTDILVTAIMGIICFFPFGLFVRGIIQSD